MSNPSVTYDIVQRFMALFQGLDKAFGTGRGEWIKREPKHEDFDSHLYGYGPGIGIAPLREDNTVMFAAIDLDEPDFEAAFEMQAYIPGASFVERSRSGNAHVWVFFEKPCPAWVAMGILKEATLAAGKNHVEVFPKNPDFARVSLGNYINLPYHGDQRPVVVKTLDGGTLPRPSGFPTPLAPLSLEQFLSAAETTKNNPVMWERRAALMQISDPTKRRESGQEFGKAKTLHICAQHLIENIHTNPITTGHRAVAYFVLAKALANCEMFDFGESWEIMEAMNEASAPDSISSVELRRILRNAYDKQYTSTGCDDPVFAPYASPECPIANPRR